MKSHVMTVCVATAMIWTLAAQTQVAFKARLSPLPVDTQLVGTITGHGSVSALLAGNKLTLNGTFEGLHSAATAAHLNQGKVIGVPGAAIHDLTVSRAMSGSISGSVDLTAPESEALRKGLLYIVVQSVGAPEGNLWGWLLK